jgi:hypothetical protein
VVPASTSLACSVRLSPPPILSLPPPEGTYIFIFRRPFTTITSEPPREEAPHPPPPPPTPEISVTTPALGILLPLPGGHELMTCECFQCPLFSPFGTRAPRRCCRLPAPQSRVSQPGPSRSPTAPEAHTSIRCDESRPSESPGDTPGLSSSGRGRRPSQLSLARLSASCPSLIHEGCYGPIFPINYLLSPASLPLPSAAELV